jgi:hypothetical protein
LVHETVLKFIQSGTTFKDEAHFLLILVARVPAGDHQSGTGPNGREARRRRAV